MRKRSRKPEAVDLNQIAARMTRHTVDATEPDLSDEDTRKALARALGRLGRLNGGPAQSREDRAKRSESASKAARTRWGSGAK